MTVPRVFADLSTPLIADACVRRRVGLRTGPPGLRPLVAGWRVAGPALPVRHYGSVDAFLEAFEGAPSGAVLVVDNGGRLDEACVGDLTALEARAAGLAGAVIWGLHRDSKELREIGWPVFSLGSVPPGPLRVDPRPSDEPPGARVGEVVVTRDDLVFADDDGVLFVPKAKSEEVLAAAAAIRATEREQARRIVAGTTLREQLRFADYLRAREKDPSLTFRAHLRAIGGAIEE